MAEQSIEKPEKDVQEKFREALKARLEQVAKIIPAPRSPVTAEESAKTTSGGDMDLDVQTLYDQLSQHVVAALGTQRLTDQQQEKLQKIATEFRDQNPVQVMGQPVFGMALASWQAAKPGIAGRLRARNAQGKVGFDLSKYAVLEAAVYDMFADPSDCPTKTKGHMGCRRVTITLGPKQQFGQPGTNATARFPRALATACETYPDKGFKSGHVLNADFGGPDAAKNMTILTASANSSQRTFDTNIKGAQNTLYHVYATLAQCKPTDQGFFDNLGYGIKVKIEMGGGVWGQNYPANCISSQMLLMAAVVGEANVRTAVGVEANFSNSTPSKLSDVVRLLQEVRALVDTALAGSPIDNT